MRNSLKRRKLLVPFSFPESLQAKRFFMSPYIGDNSIETSKIEEKQTISWIRDIPVDSFERINSSTAKRMGSDGKETLVF